MLVSFCFVRCSQCFAECFCHVLLALPVVHLDTAEQNKEDEWLIALSKANGVGDKRFPLPRLRRFDFGSAAAFNQAAKLVAEFRSVRPDVIVDVVLFSLHA